MEADLAARLGVSRNPIREAISRLQQQGLVITVANRGACIIQPTPEQAYDMFVLRANLEHLALRLAFAHWTPVTFAAAADVVQRMKSLVRTSRRLNEDVWGEFSLLDTEFHTCLVEASGNSALLRAWETAAPTDMIFLYDRTRTVTFTRSELQGMTDRHTSLLKALLHHDVAAAQSELRRHFMSVSRGGTVSLDEPGLAILNWDGVIREDVSV